MLEPSHSIPGAEDRILYDDGISFTPQQLRGDLRRSWDDSVLECECNVQEEWILVKEVRIITGLVVQGSKMTVIQLSSGSKSCLRFADVLQIRERENDVSFSGRRSCLVR